MSNLTQKEKARVSFNSGIVDHEETKLLKESEEKYRSLVESSGFGIASIDLRGRFTFVNEALCKMTGYSKKELIGKHFASFLCSEDKQWILKIFLNAWKYPTRRPSLEFRAVHKKGQVVYMYSTPTLYRRNGKIQGFSAIITDITERKKAERVMLENQQKFERLFRGVPEAAVYWDTNFRFLDVNPRFTEFFGHSLEEVKGKRNVEIIVPENKLEEANLLGKMAEEGYVDYDTVRKKKDGSLVDVSISVAPMVVESRIVGYVGLYKDITERKKAKEKLQESEERYRLLFEHSSMGIGIATNDGTIIDCNKAMQAVTGYSKEEFRKINLADTYEDPKQRKALLEIVRRKRAALDFLARLKRKDGTLYDALLSVSLIRIGNKDFLQTICQDITERKKAEEALLDERDKLETVTKNIGVGLAIVSRDYRTLWANEVLKQLFGDVEGKICHTTYNKRYEICPKCGVREVFETGKDKAVHEQVGKDVNGKIIWSEIIATPIKDKSGNITAALEVVVPITERKKVQQALEESEEKYRNLFENARDVILTTNLEGNVTSINKAIEEYGWKREELIGKNMLELMSKESWPSLLKGMEQIAEGEPLEGEIELATPIGKKIAEYKSNPIIQDNKIVGVQVIGRDITERKKMEEKLKQYSEHLKDLVQEKTEELLESEKRYSVLIEESKDGVVIAQDEQIVFANKRAAEMLGYSREEVIGISTQKVVTEDYYPIVKERYAQRLRGRKVPATYEIEFLTKTGLHIPIEINSTRIDYQGRPAVLVMLRDVRERKRIEEQRLKLEKLATIGELATMVAHDLRNPLTSIRNASFYIKKSCPQQSNVECKTNLEMVNTIERETLFANDIINELLDFASSRQLQKSRQNLSEIIEHSITINHVPENMKIERNLARKVTVEADEKQLERVFLNLIKNAAQAMPKGGKLEITMKETKDTVEVVFADTGTGITEENMDKIFTPFFTTKAKGIGLGLPICKRIVEEHGGTITVKSKINQGAIFTIKLPREGEKQ